MTYQHETALHEMRNRINSKAKRTLWVDFTNPRTGINPRAIEFRVSIELNEEEIEVESYKKWLNNLFDDTAIRISYKSCEELCDELYEYVASRYPYRDIEITASEDIDNGVTISYNTTQPLTNLKI
jgi:hypothetical protein